MGAYCASKAAVEAIGDSLRIELRPSGARVGVAYFAEIETDMTARGMRTEAASRMIPPDSRLAKARPLSLAVDALERGIAQRSRRVFAPGWVRAAMPARMLVQRALDAGTRRVRVADAVRIARTEGAPFTTAQPEEAGAVAESEAEAEAEA
jgi:NAD(P)-dependent dehydrogenase (short-subunit alcohol dehydrogenase family)